jgi:hypothetical protein
MSVDQHCIVQAVSEMQFQQLHDDLLGIDQRAGQCYALNLSAARIWALASEPVSVSELCSTLCAEFEVEREVCSRDLIEFLLAMKAAGLIRVSDDAAH